MILYLLCMCISIYYCTLEIIKYICVIELLELIRELRIYCFCCYCCCKEFSIYWYHSASQIYTIFDTIWINKYINPCLSLLFNVVEKLNFMDNRYINGWGWFYIFSLQFSTFRDNVVHSLYPLYTQQNPIKPHNTNSTLSHK